jgi:hypothetical protein
MTIARRPVIRVSQLIREGEEWNCGQGEGVIVEVAGVEEDMVDEAASREEERWLKSMGTFMERSFIALDSIEIFVFSEVQLSVLKEERKKGGKIGSVFIKLACLSSQPLSDEEVTTPPLVSVYGRDGWQRIGQMLETSKAIRSRDLLTTPHFLL